MIDTLRRLWATRRALFVSFCAAVLLTGFFGIRLIAGFVYWSDPAHRDQTIAGWMTPGYIVRSWDVPPEVLAAALDLPRDEGRRRLTLTQIAEERGETVADLAGQIEAAVRSFRAQP